MKISVWLWQRWKWDRQRECRGFDNMMNDNVVTNIGLWPVNDWMNEWMTDADRFSVRMNTGSGITHTQ